MDSEHVKHPSYGQASISRVTSNKGAVMYGSTLKHDSFLSFRLYQSELWRDSGIERYHTTGKCLVEFDLSEAQFTQLITTMNIGSGVPVTLRHINGQNVERPPERNERVKIDEDIKKAANKAVENSRAVLASIGQMIESGKFNKTEMRKLYGELSNAIQHMTGSAPFLIEMFNESLEKAVTSAKADFDAYIQMQVQQAGLEKLGITTTSESLMLPEVTKSKPPMCEECDELMNPFARDGVSGWSCDSCGWSIDDNDNL